MKLCVVSGAQLIEHSPQCAVRAARCAVRGARCAVRGARCAVRGARCLVRGVRDGLCDGLCRYPMKLCCVLC